MDGVTTDVDGVYAALLTIGPCGTVMAGSTVAEEVAGPDVTGDTEPVPIDPVDAAGVVAGATAGVIAVFTAGGVVAVLTDGVVAVFTAGGVVTVFTAGLPDDVVGVEAEPLAGVATEPTVVVATEPAAVPAAPVAVVVGAGVVAVVVVVGVDEGFVGEAAGVAGFVCRSLLLRFLLLFLAAEKLTSWQKLSFKHRAYAA